MQENKFQVALGGDSVSIYDQLKQQGLTFHIKEVNLFQDLSDSITLLFIKGVLPAGEVEQARKRLFKKIQSHINDLN